MTNIKDIAGQSANIYLFADPNAVVAYYVFLCYISASIQQGSRVVVGFKEIALLPFVEQIMTSLAPLCLMHRNAALSSGAAAVG